MKIAHPPARAIDLREPAGNLDKLLALFAWRAETLIDYSEENTGSFGDCRGYFSWQAREERRIRYGENRKGIV